MVFKTQNPEKCGDSQFLSHSFNFLSWKLSASLSEEGLIIGLKKEAREFKNSGACAFLILVRGENLLEGIISPLGS